MNKLTIILTLLVPLFLSGCETTGGIIGGLIPAPKFLKGEIKSNIYISQDKMFSIKIPHNESSYEYKYMNIKEQYHNLGAYISFGPAAYDKSIYRLETAYTLTPESQKISVEANVPKIISGFASQLEKGYGTKLKLQSKDKIKINGNSAYHRVFTQVIPAGKHISNKSTLFKHEAYVIDYKRMVGIIWVQTPTESQPRASLSPLLFATSLKQDAQQGN